MSVIESRPVMHRLRGRTEDSALVAIQSRKAPQETHRLSHPVRRAPFSLFSPFVVTWISVFTACVCLFDRSLVFLIVVSGLGSFAYLAFDAWYRSRNFDRSYSDSTIWLVPGICVFGAVAILLVTVL
jgi:hypothetical protein